jgi:hypothetical protein
MRRPTSTGVQATQMRELENAEYIQQLKLKSKKLWRVFPLSLRISSHSPPSGATFLKLGDRVHLLLTGVGQSAILVAMQYMVAFSSRFTEVEVRLSLDRDVTVAHITGIQLPERQ